jgi:hypothetical protein
MRLNLIKVDEVSKFLLLSVVLSQLFLNNGLYLFLCLATLSVLFFLVQQTYKPGVFALILVQHILQIIAGVFLSNYLGKDINYRSSEQSTAIYLSLIGVVFLFIPIIYYQTILLPKVNRNDLKEAALKLSTEKVLRYYLISFFATALLGASFSFLGGLAQIFVSLLKVKWIFFLLFGFLAFLKNEKKNIFYLCVLLEIVSGFFSFFSEFKTVLYFLMILALSFIYTINIRQMLIASFIGIILFLLALFWTSVKGEYRSFLNGGTKDQTVDVSRDEAFNKLADLSNKVDNDELSSSTKSFLDRIQYTYHFAKTIERVPAVVPYQNGQNWLENIEFVTTPRFLNPDKPTIDNSVKTSKYTGLHYLTAKSGVSFSLGYFAECYVDFGPIGMMVLLLILGWIYGLVYKYLITKSSNNILFNYSVVGAFFMEFMMFEADGTFLIGRFLSTLVTFILLIQFIFPDLIKNLAATQTKK